MHTPKRGFTLLLAALVVSIVLTLGAAIYTIALKQVRLSSLGRDSQFAFYAADMGAECALYWDLRFGYFATATPATVAAPNPQCAGQSLDAMPPHMSGRTGTYPYSIDFTYEPNGYCVDISVEKEIDADNVIRTTIHADGLSVGCAQRDTSTRALQRSVELHY